MFTGIILAIGKITLIQPHQGDYRLTIDTGALPLNDVMIGDSIAVNGVCLTVIKLGAHFFCADVSNESISKTTLAEIQIGTPVNLELALTLAMRLGGHLVSGHVDGVGKVVKNKADARSIRLTIKFPEPLKKYIAEKGSICIDGISLTVNEVIAEELSVNIVPHTLKQTTLGQIKIGANVNLEVDLLARYLEKLMNTSTTSQPCHPVSKESLQQSGFNV